MGKRRSGPTLADRVTDLVGNKLAVPPQANAVLPLALRHKGRAYLAARSPLGYLISRIPGGRRAVFHLLTLADDDDAKALTKAYTEIVPTNRDSMSIEEIIERAGVSPRDFIGVVSKVAYDFNLEVGNTLAAFAYPKIMQASIDRAVDPRGGRERRIHLEKTGFAVTKGAPFIQVNNQNQQNNDDREPEPGEAPRMSHTARRIVRDLPPVR